MSSDALNFVPSCPSCKNISDVESQDIFKENNDRDSCFRRYCFDQFRLKFRALIKLLCWCCLKLLWIEFILIFIVSFYVTGFKFCFISQKRIYTSLYYSTLFGYCVDYLKLISYGWRTSVSPLKLERLKFFKFNKILFLECFYHFEQFEKQ